MQPSSISALFHDLDPIDRLRLATRAPAPWLVTGEDRLRVTARNIAAGVTVRIAGRFLTADAVIVPVSFDLTPATDLSASSADYALGDGWLLNLTARVVAGSPQTGETFLTVDVVRGSGATAILLGTLIAAYVSDIDAPAWPGSLIDSATAGAGGLRVITGANPAAGAETLITITAGMRFRPRTWIAALTTDATVANREVFVQITAGGVLVFSASSVVAHVASQVRNYSAYPGATRQTPPAGLDLTIPWPVLDLRGGDTITTVTTNLQAGDNWAAPSVYGESFLDA